MCDNVQCGNVQWGNGQANLTGGNEADVRQIQKQGATIYAEPNGCAYFFPYNVLMHTQANLKLYPARSIVWLKLMQNLNAEQSGCG